jgi:dTDP-L-oleandrosyltransferase
MPQHILFVVIGGTGHVLPALGVAAALTARGHRVTYLTTGEFAGAVTAVGARFAPYRSVFEDIALPDVVAHEDAETYSRMLFLDENLAMLRAAEEQLDDDPPDLVAYDIFPLIAGRLLAARWQRPAVCLSGAFTSNEHYNIWQQMTEAQGHRPWAENETFRTAVEKLLTEYGVEQSVADLFQEPEAYTIAFYPRSWQIRGETFDERFHYVGPSFAPQRLESAWRPPVDDRPVLLVSLGSSFNDHPEFFRACARSFAGTRWHVVMAIGSSRPEDLGDLPDNVEIHPWISFMEVLPHTDVFLTQGTVGATMEGMYWGVPLVIFTEFAAEAKPTAGRALELGLGRELTRAEVEAGDLPAVVEQVLADPDLRERVGRMRDDARQAGGAAAAADGIEAYLRRVAG